MKGTSRAEPRLARVAAMIADPARSRMLAYLMAGHWASAGELARAAEVGAPTASGHLAKLLDAGLVACEPRGRHRYYRLADGDVAHALEALALVAERDAHDRAWLSPARGPLRFARRCYGHLAGSLGVAMLDALLERRALATADADRLALTVEGRAWLDSIGCEAPTPRAGARLAYRCLDWSERRDHLAGALAGTLLARFVERRWLAPVGATGAFDRALALTAEGRVALPAHLGPVVARAIERADLTT